MVIFYLLMGSSWRKFSTASKAKQVTFRLLQNTVYSVINKSQYFWRYDIKSLLDYMFQMVILLIYDLCRSNLKFCPWNLSYHIRIGFMATFSYPAYFYCLFIRSEFNYQTKKEDEELWLFLGSKSKNKCYFVEKGWISERTFC